MFNLDFLPNVCIVPFEAPFPEMAPIDWSIATRVLFGHTTVKWLHIAGIRRRKEEWGAVAFVVMVGQDPVDRSLVETI